MPNAKVLSEKQAIVEALVERIKSAGAGILVDYRGITVLEDTALRAEMRKEGIEYTVVKNTLTRKALDKLGMSGLDEVLKSEIAEIAALPSKDALYAKVLGTMIAPITGLAVCLGQILEQKGGSLESAAPEAAAE